MCCSPKNYCRLFIRYGLHCYFLTYKSFIHYQQIPTAITNKFVSVTKKVVSNVKDFVRNTNNFVSNVVTVWISS